MRKHCCLSFLLFLLFLLSFNDAAAQFSGVKWQHVSDFFLDRDMTNFTRAVAAKNKSVFLVGETYSRGSGDPYNLIICKVNSDGGREWEKVFNNDDAYTGYSKAVVETSLAADGGLIVLSRSQNYNFSGHHGVDTITDFSGDGENGRDVLLMKISESGELVWRRFFGGKRMDHATGMLIDQNGNILIAGTTYSADGDFLHKRRSFDSSAYYSDSARYPKYFDESNDAFVAKFSPAGELIKVKCYGGSKSDALSSIILNGQQGFYVVGSTQSADLDVSTNSIGIANWFLKIDTAFNLIEEHCIRSTKGFMSYYSERHFLKQKKNGKLLFSNGLVHWNIDTSGSVISGPFNLGLSNHDYFDEAENLYKVGGEQYNSNYNQVSKYDSSLNLIWVRKIPVTRHSGFKAITGNGLNELYFLGSTDLPYEYEPYHKYVGLAVKYSNSYNYVTGKIFADDNNNGHYDMGEKLVAGVKIEAQQNNLVTSVVSGVQGIYDLPVDTGHHVIRVVFGNSFYSVTPVSGSTYFPYINERDTINFALQPIPNKKDLQINLLPLNIPRPGFEVNYRIVGYNKGTVAIPNVQVKMAKDTRVNYLSTIPIVSSTNADTLTWSIGTVEPLDSFFINIKGRVQAPPAVNNSDTLVHKAFVLPVVGDEVIADNETKLVERVQGSYDPNDKTETHGGIITPEQLAGNDYLTYLIRFQNTGTDTAFNVMIRDTLTNKLDWSSFEMISSSHPYQLYMIKPHILEFSFPNILLVDSNRNEPASHGFVAYRIKPKSNLSVGDTVFNQAHIYFDYNLPVITNNEQTILRNTIVTSVVDLNMATNQLLLYPNPSNGLITISRKGRLAGKAVVSITDINGRVVKQNDMGQIAVEQFNQSIDITGLSRGLYVVKLQVGKTAYLTKFVLQ